MKKLLLLHLFLYNFLSISYAQITDTSIFTQSPTVSPKHEMRAVWLTTIGGIDWPHSYSQSEASAKKQQDELCAILDKLVAAGINTVLLQTRVRATTIFPSSKEPWDGCLSGFPGKSPGYDALEFAIQECHKRGIKLHAWVVTIPIGKWNGTGCKNLRNTYPNLVKRIGDEGFMNPELSGTATYLADFCKEIAEHYDIDGIHLDYIRYPETWKVISDRNQGRKNITEIVTQIHNAVKSIKPWIMLSCSPVGKYADTKRMWSHGWNARDIVCQDAASWLKSGIMDALFPMMYFKGDNFYPFAIDWKERSEGRIITPGLGIYFMHPREKNWPLEDITREMHVLRQYDMGTCMFRSKFFTDNTKGIYDYTKEAFAYQPALQPAMAWYDNVSPTPPAQLEVIPTNDGTTIVSWTSASKDYSLDNKLTYNVYGSCSFPVDTTDPNNLLAVSLSDTITAMSSSEHIRYFAVTSTDRYGNESSPIQMNIKYISDEKEEGGKIKKNDTARLFLPYNNERIILSSKDAEEGLLTIISSIVGNDLASRFIKKEGESIYVDTKGLQPGHYIISTITKKGIRHHLGIFEIPLTTEH